MLETVVGWLFGLLIVAMTHETDLFAYAFSDIVTRPFETLENKMDH